MHINKRYIADKRGNPKEVVILLEDYRKIKELLGLDLDDEAVKQLQTLLNQIIRRLVWRILNQGAKEQQRNAVTH